MQGVAQAAADGCRRQTEQSLELDGRLFKLGLDERKIQLYEATDYQWASPARIREVVRALEIEIREEVKLSR